MNPLLLKEFGGLAGGLFNLIDELFTSDDERSEAKLKIMALLAADRQGQMAVNAKEAEHKSLFVAGWRPAIGWIGALALGWQYILLPIFTTVVTTIATVNNVPVDFSGVLQFSAVEMMPIILGMLGLSVSRSYEKGQGVSSSNMGGS